MSKYMIAFCISLGAMLLTQTAKAQQCGGGGCDCTECDCIQTGGDGSLPECDPSCGCCDSPVIVDTTGRGFHLTSAEDGVVFDISGTGHPVKMAWTGRDSGNTFLALDRNHNGKIDDGKELFGNYTEQPPCEDGTRACLNGYRALAEFDKPENGGNGDGIIDSRDAIYSKLLLWIDANHDGISQPEELHTLPELGVFSIGLHYRDDLRFRDQYGDWFHYQAALNPDLRDGTSRDGRLTYDVFFVAARLPNFSARGILDLSPEDSYQRSNDSFAPLSQEPAVLPTAQHEDWRGGTSNIIANDAGLWARGTPPAEMSPGRGADIAGNTLQAQAAARPVSTPPVSISSPGTVAKMKISNPLEAEGLKLIASDSPEFRSALEGMIDPDLIARAEPFLPYSVILVNMTGRYIWGFTAIYTYPDKIAPSGKPRRIQINPSAGGVGTREQYLAPEARYLLTPVSNFLAEADADGRRRLRPSWYEGIEEVMRIQSGVGDPLMQRVELSIDSVIYEDGMLVGPDRAGRMDEVNRRILREKQFADSFKGLTGSAFEAKLAEYSSKAGGDIDERANAWRAKDLELRYNAPTLGEDHVRRFIEAMGSAQWFLGSQKVRRGNEEH